MVNAHDKFVKNQSAVLMNAKVTLLTLILLIASGYIIAFIGSPLLFMVYLYIVLLIVSFAVFSLTVNLILMTAPKSIRKDYSHRRMTFNLTVLASYIIFLFLVWIMNRYFFSEASPLARLIGKLGIVFFAIFLGWALLRRARRVLTLSGILIFIVFVSIVSNVKISGFERSESLSIESLRSLPYLRWVPVEKTIEKTGVTLFDTNKSIRGINLYASRNKPSAFLMDMSGNILHKWTAKISDNDSWQHIEVCKNGDLLAYVSGEYLMRLDWDSKIKWIRNLRVHHDMAVDENGNIYILARKDKIVFIHGVPAPILADFIAVFSSNGEEVKEIPLYKILKSQISPRKLASVYADILGHELMSRDFFKKLFTREAAYFFKHGTAFDIFHNNAVEIIDKNIEGLCKKGDILISVRELNLVGVLDSKKERLYWIWGPNRLSRQHHPTLLNNGNILVFDNGPDRNYSRVIELNPILKEIKWEYKSQRPEDFFSSIRGWCQRLPKGNTLITESNKGRVFEVTKDGSLVWEFYNPDLNEKKDKRAAIYSMERIVDLEKRLKLREFIKDNTKYN